MSRPGLLPAAVLIGLAAGCARPRAGLSAEDCLPADGYLPAETAVRAMAGAYELVMVATTGDSAGRRTAGRLRLGPSSRDDAALLGSAGIALEAVGALRLGELEPEDAEAPGVLVFDRGGDPKSVMLRLGTESNQRDVRRFDGGYTVLEVRRAGEQGLAGSWRSGLAARTVASGHFCARRADPVGPQASPAPGASL